MVIICTARFNTKNLHFAYTVYLFNPIVWFLQQRLLPYTEPTDFFSNGHGLCFLWVTNWICTTQIHFSRRLLTAQAWVRSSVSPCDFRVGTLTRGRFYSTPFRFSPVSVIPPMQHSHLHIYMLSFKENLSGFFPWDLPVVKISPEWVTGPEQGKSSGRIATFSLPNWQKESW